MAAEARRIAAELSAAGIRTRVDDQTATGFGRRVTDWELKGVPVRVEIGPRDLKEGVVTLVRRDARGKEPVPAAGLAGAVGELLEASRPACWPRPRPSATPAPRPWRPSRTPSRPGGPGSRASRGSAVGDEGEDRLAEHGITVRCLQRPDGGVPDDLEGPLVAVVARAY